jgi:pimeloyl-ACP methyl ester carboxylesterase
MRRFLADASTHANVDALVGAAHAVSPRSDRDLLRYRYHYMTSVQPDGWRWRHDTRHKPDYGQMTRKLAELEQLTDVIACPVLVAVGARSRVLSEAAAQRFAARFASGRAVPIADAGHNVQEDNPRALADALRAHFDAADAHAG